jgi:hypothetical protein
MITQSSTEGAHLPAVLFGGEIHREIVLCVSRCYAFVVTRSSTEILAYELNTIPITTHRNAA